MLTALTIYFWFCFALHVVSWIYNFLRPVKVKIGKPSKTEERFAAGCVLLALMPLFVLIFAVPIAYLHSVALTALGFPAWLAWVGLGLNALRGVSILWKQTDMQLIGASQPFMLWHWLLAWYGLQVLVS